MSPPTGEGVSGGRSGGSVIYPAPQEQVLGIRSLDKSPRGTRPFSRLRIQTSDQTQTLRATELPTFEGVAETTSDRTVSLFHLSLVNHPHGPHGHPDQSTIPTRTMPTASQHIHAPPPNTLSPITALMHITLLSTTALLQQTQGSC